MVQRPILKGSEHACLVGAGGTNDTFEHACFHFAENKVMLRTGNCKIWGVSGASFNVKLIVCRTCTHFGKHEAMSDHVRLVETMGAQSASHILFDGTTSSYACKMHDAGVLWAHAGTGCFDAAVWLVPESIAVLHARQNER